MSDVAERVKKIVVEHLGVDADKVVENANFIDDLGADSLDTVELVMAFEEEFGVEIPDDQAETILHRIIRGTGLRGLAGMPSQRVLSWDPPVTLIRPLLSVSRQAIRTSLGSLGQGFREDASNADQARTRARIRHDLLPRLARE